jgi:hypothetical protein
MGLMAIARVHAGLSIGLGIALFGCTGPDGPIGITGDAGAPGPQGVGVEIDGGVVATSCLSPCHGFNGVVTQFKASHHYAAYVSFLATPTADEWTAPGSACGNCHAIDALARRVAGNVGTKANASVANVARGVLEYSGANGALADSTYTGSATVAEVYCTTCHAVTDANDPHKTGKPWTPKSFPFVVASGASDLVFIEKSASTSAVTGTSIGSLGTSNVCVMCHKSRKDVTRYITSSTVLTSVYWGPHEGPEADVFSGQGGYQYPGMAYGTSTHQVKLNCVSCHMPDLASNSGVSDHTMVPRVSTCQSCHLGVTSFDVNGGQSQVDLSMSELEAALSTAGFLTRSPTAPYLPLQPDELTDKAFATDLARPGGPPLTAAQAGAVYNYMLVARGSAHGVHNPKYVNQLIFDSIVGVTGMPPVSIARPQ